MFEIKLDAQGVENMGQEAVQRAAEMLPMLAESLAVATFSYIQKQANAKLKTSRRLYVENLKMDKKGEDSYEIWLEPPAHWIEDGRQAGSMVDAILQGPGPLKHFKDGTPYKIVPFRHNSPPNLMTSTQVELRDVIREVFKEKGIEWGQPSQTAERRNAEGFWKDGERLATRRIGSLDIMDKPVKTHEGKGQGQGPVGDVRQGMTGIPHLQGIRIYENDIKTSHGDLVTQKDVMTFRTVTAKHKEQGRWMHPGTEPKRLFDDGHRWASDKWAHEMKPELMRFVKEGK